MLLPEPDSPTSAVFLPSLHHEAGTLNDIFVLIGKGHVLKYRRVLLPRKGAAITFQRLGIQSLFQFFDFPVHLRERGTKRIAFISGPPSPKERQRTRMRSASCDQPFTTNMPPNGSVNSEQAREHSRIHRHPRQHTTVPVKRKIAVRLHVLFIPFIRVAVPAEHFDDFHAVDVFDDGVVHDLRRAVVTVHFWQSRRASSS